MDTFEAFLDKNTHFAVSDEIMKASKDYFKELNKSDATKTVENTYEVTPDEKPTTTNKPKAKKKTAKKT